LSRNRGFGERIGKGETVAGVLAGMVSVAEGYPTSRSAWQLAQKHKVVTPVIDEVYLMLYEGKDVKRGVRDLMSRDSKAED
jgi:glycerol-3-phosphate dehydrogenase (NAD(P)+)